MSQSRASATYYQILGIEKNALPDEIKKAYRKKMKALHPDKNESETATAETAAVNEAYEVLKDPQKRHQYDTKDEQKPLSALNQSGSVFGIPIADISNIMNLINKGSSNPDESYKELFNINSWFTTYIKEIFAMLDKGHDKPAVIFDALLQVYIDTKDSIFSFYGYRLVNLPLVTLLQAAIEQHKNPDDALTSIWEVLNEQPMTVLDETKFFELLNAFYSVYPNYLVYLKDPAFRQKLRITSLDDIYYKTIFMKIVNEPDQKILIGEERVPLIQLTNSMDDYLSYIITKLKSDFSDLEWGEYFESLRVLTKYADRGQVVNKILPFIISVLDNNLRMGYIPDGYHILMSAMRIVSPEIVQRTVIPLLKQNADMLCHEYSIIQALACAAQVVPKATVEAEIMPLLLRKISCERLQDCVYEVLLKILPKLPVADILSVIKAGIKLKKEAPNTNSDTQTNFLNFIKAGLNWHQSLKTNKYCYAMLCQIQLTLTSGKDSIAQDLVASIQSLFDAIQAEVALKIKVMDVLEAGVPVKTPDTAKAEALTSEEKIPNFSHLSQEIQAAAADLEIPESVTKFDILDNLEWLLIFADAAVLQNKLVPFLLKHIGNPEEIYMRMINDALIRLAELPSEKIPAALKEQCLQKVFNHIDVGGELEKKYKAIAALAPFVENSALKVEICRYFLNKIDFNSRSIFGKGHECIEVLTAVVSALDQAFIQIKLIPYLLEKIQFRSSQEKGFKMFEQALKKADPAYAVLHVLPVLMQKIGFGSYVTNYINQIIPHLSYPERVYYSRSLLKNFESGSLDQWEKTHVLCQIYRLNKVESETLKANVLTENLQMKAH